MGSPLQLGVTSSEHFGDNSYIGAWKCTASTEKLQGGITNDWVGYRYNLENWNTGILIKKGG